MPRTWDAQGRDLGYVEDDTDRRRAAASSQFEAVQNANPGGAWTTVNGQPVYQTASGQTAANYNDILSSVTAPQMNAATTQAATPGAGGPRVSRMLGWNNDRGQAAVELADGRQAFLAGGGKMVDAGGNTIFDPAAQAAPTTVGTAASAAQPAVGLHAGAAPVNPPPSQQNPAGAGGAQPRFKMTGTLDTAGGGYFTDAQTGEQVYVDRYGNLSRDGGKTYTAQAGATAQQLSTGAGPSQQPTQSGTTGQVVAAPGVGAAATQTQSGTHGQVVAAPSVAAGVTAPTSPTGVYPTTQPYQGATPDWALFQRDPTAYAAWQANQQAVAARVSQSPRTDVIQNFEAANPGGVWTNNAQGQPVYRTAGGQEIPFSSLGISATPGPVTVAPPVAAPSPAVQAPVTHAVATQAADLDPGTTVRPENAMLPPGAAAPRPYAFDADWGNHLRQQLGGWLNQPGLAFPMEDGMRYALGNGTDVGAGSPVPWDPANNLLYPEALGPRPATQPNQDLAAYRASLPRPNQIVARNWARLPQTSRDFLLGTYEAMGYDPNDVEETVSRTAPTWAVPRYGSVRA